MAQNNNNRPQDEYIDEEFESNELHGGTYTEEFVEDVYDGYVGQYGEIVAPMHMQAYDPYYQQPMFYEELAYANAHNATYGANRISQLEHELTHLKQVYGAAIQPQQSTQQANEMQVELGVLKDKISDAQNRERSLQDEIQRLKKTVEGLTSIPAVVENPSQDEIIENEISKIQAMFANKNGFTSEQSKAIQEKINTLLNEIVTLKNDLEEVQNGELITEDSASTALNEISDKLNTLLYGTSSEDNDNIQLLIADIAEIKEKVFTSDETLLSAVNKLSENVATKEDIIKTNDLEISTVDDMGLILDELAVLREEVKISAPTQNNDGINMLVNEVVLLRDEIQAYRDDLTLVKTELLNKPDDNPNGVVSGEVIEQLHKLCSDLAVQINAKNSEQIVTEIQSLRDQMFAVNMAHISGGKGKKNEYESYNNIILDEIKTLRDEIKQNKEAKESVGILQTEVAVIKEALVKYSEDLKSAVAMDIGHIKDSVKETASSVEQFSAVQEQIAEIYGAIENISNLNKELATTASTEHVKNSTQSKKVSKVTDDSDLTKSLADFQKELSSIADMVSDSNVTDKKKPVSNVKSTSKKTGAIEEPVKKQETKPATKSTSKKTTATDKNITSKTTLEMVSKPKSATTVAKSTTEKKTETKLEVKPTAVKKKVIANLNSNEDELDIASRLAKQVANKLVMEQLVHQLGDGNVPQSKVEEIVQEILPQDFTTIQIDRQSEQVRRLANSLVLDKLRDRLKKN